MPTGLIFVLAAVSEIAGCYCFWAWMRLSRALWMLPTGLVFLSLFAYLLTIPDSAAAGRIYAVYGGIYVLIALAWMAMVEHVMPDSRDWAGAGLILAGTLVIVLGRHS
ncbi:YnfA family protein [Granulibacter bethesdensis]|nr:YnfA family protein [Granulibacter bethesdensis]